MGNMEPFDFPLIKSKMYKSQFKISNFFDAAGFDVGEEFTCIVCNVYDVSKFWISPIYNQLDQSQFMVNGMYHLSFEKVRLPLNEVKENMYCVALVDGIFYRAEVVRIVARSFSQIKVVAVNLIDFGMVRVISVHLIFYMHQSYFQVPKLAIRARLADALPYTVSWLPPSIQMFQSLVQGKILTAKITMVDAKQRAIFVTLREFNASPSNNVLNTLLEHGLAKYDESKNLKRQIRYRKHPYGALFPSFHEIEYNLLN